MAGCCSFTTVAVGGLAVAICFYFFRRFLQGGRCYSKARLDGKTVIITGCNTGIGKESAKDLAKRGARVIMACRDLKKAEEAQLWVIRESGNKNVVVKKLDLASMKSIRDFAAEIKREEKHLEILLNNAGIMMCPHWKTDDGFEMQFGVNHLGHFLLTHLLLDLLKASAPSRIVNVSSSAHKFGKMHFDDIMLTKKYSSMASYGQSKLANVLFTRELAKKLKGTGVTCYSLHPGGVDTDLQRHSGTYGIILKLLMPVMRLFFKTAEQGAQTNIYCCVDEKAANETGLYYSDCAPASESAAAKDDEAAEKLWKLSVELVRLDQQ
ncbi:retinol dehydrogenase 12-like [Diadema antillarum]|uniref:retinol dehydrogenase 12-like n=1 Tax=Diadema antillarum TaxID=105358 RepID=UPI003A8BF83E